jgi:hypothetical protein
VKRPTVEILFVAWNRLDFTTASWAWMVAHTNWQLVSKVVIYDDGSEDGTQEFLRDREGIEFTVGKRKHVVPVELRVSDLRSPPAIMNHYLATSEVDLFAKIDNDIALPPKWLDTMVNVIWDRPDLDLLGMEAGMVALQGRDGLDLVYDIEPCTHIGGVGVMRVGAFRSRPAIPFRGRFGFGEWQQRYEVSRAWIVPDINCPQLDRLPFEPWLSLTETYIENGWSREWPKYDAQWMRPYWEWLDEHPLGEEQEHGQAV